MKTKIKADVLILDVDGTIWDSTPLVAEAWTKAVKEQGYEKKVTAVMLRGLFGKPMDIIADELLPEIKSPRRYEVIRKCEEAEDKALRENICDIAYPRVVDTIKELSQRMPLCIVSNCQSGYIELVTEKLGIAEYISDKECYGDTGLYKAENIRLVTERNGYRYPSYVGDIQSDEDAAHKAGASFIHAAYGFGTAAHPDAVIESFEELLELIIPVKEQSR